MGRKDGSSTSGMTAFRNHNNVPVKDCIICERPFTWRKKWEKCWDEVTTCSQRCNAERRAKNHDNGGAKRPENESAGEASETNQDTNVIFEEQTSKRKPKQRTSKPAKGAQIRLAAKAENASENESLGEASEFNQDTNVILEHTSNRKPKKRASKPDKGEHISPAAKVEEASENESTGEGSESNQDTNLILEQFEQSFQQATEQEEDESRSPIVDLASGDDTPSMPAGAQSPQELRRAHKQAVKAERRAQRSGLAEAAVSKQKPCHECKKGVDLLVRCTTDESQQWRMLCGRCWTKASGGVPDGDADHPHYRYGGLWKNRAATSTSSSKRDNGDNRTKTLSFGAQHQEQASKCQK